MNKKWILESFDNKKISMITKKFNISRVVACIILGRKILFKEIDQYLFPTLKSTMPDPYNIQDMEKTAYRIAEAIINNQKIGIIGDYDVDGATSTALILRYIDKLINLNKNIFKNLNKLEFYIPNRQIEGYGPSIKAIDTLILKSCKLIITVDCGVTAFKSIKYAKNKLIDVIVLDHHITKENLPDAFSIVNPNRLDDMSNLGYLAACGVVFLTLVAINRIFREKYKFKINQLPNLMSLLDLVALGTVCDIVPLIKLNRSFVKQGLKIISQFNNQGIKSIVNIAKITEKIKEYHLGYIIGPMINSGSRIGDSNLGSIILSTKNNDKANLIAIQLNKYNKKRQIIQRTMLNSALEQVDKKLNKNFLNIILIHNFNWHQGIIGIIAARIKDQYNLPTIVITFDENKGKGSGRSIFGVDLGQAIRKAVDKKIIINGGGHKMAVGFSINKDQLIKFQIFIEKELGISVIKAQKKINFKIDSILTVKKVKLKLLNLLEELEPYGLNNSKPLFLFPYHYVDNIRVINKDHLKFNIYSLDKLKLNVIAFNAKQNGLIKLLINHNSKPFHFIGNLKINKWQNYEVAQLQLIDIAEVNC